MILFIDDLRAPEDVGISAPDCTVVRSSAAAIAWLDAHGCPGEIAFDHDLGGDDIAMRVVHWLILRDLDAPGFIPADFAFSVHSANPVGAANLSGTLAAYLEFRAQSRAPNT